MGQWVLNAPAHLGKVTEATELSTCCGDRQLADLLNRLQFAGGFDRDRLSGCSQLTGTGFCVAAANLSGEGLGGQADTHQVSSIHFNHNFFERFTKKINGFNTTDTPQTNTQFAGIASQQRVVRRIGHIPLDGSNKGIGFQQHIRKFGTACPCRKA